jgi:hypothetical protein
MITLLLINTIFQSPIPGGATNRSAKQLGYMFTLYDWVGQSDTSCLDYEFRKAECHGQDIVNQTPWEMPPKHAACEECVLHLRL